MYKDLIGLPFKEGGRNKYEGFDCWGLVLEIFRRHGIDLPDYKIGCAEASKIDNTIENNRPQWLKCDFNNPATPSLVVIRFNNGQLCNHTGVYIGDGQFIHTRDKIGVNIDRVDNPAWRKRIEGFYVPGWLG